MHHYVNKNVLCNRILQIKKLREKYSQVGEKPGRKNRASLVKLLNSKYEELLVSKSYITNNFGVPSVVSSITGSDTDSVTNTSDTQDLSNNDHHDALAESLGSIVLM